MRVYSDLEQAALESLSSDPSANTQGRIWQNTTSDQIKHDNGTNKRALLRNDDKVIIGSNGTAANNTRLHKGSGALLQTVPASDTTIDGTNSNTLAQTSSRIENYLDSGLPAAANAGRLMFVTDLDEYKYDNGTTIKKVVPLTAKGDLLTRTSSGLDRLPVGTDGLFLKTNSATSTGLEWVSGFTAIQGFLSKTANYTILSSDNGKVILIDSSGGAFNLTFPTPVANFKITIKDISGQLSTNAVTMIRSGSEKIEFLTSNYVLEGSYGSWDFSTNGTDWFLS